MDFASRVLARARPASRRAFAQTADQLIPPRVAQPAGTVTVTNDTALRHSAVWACLRLRADLISTFPVDVYRKVGDLAVEMSKPAILIDPGGDQWDYCDWMYASQFDLDRCGNTVGLVTERNALGLPARIDLQPISSVSVRDRPGKPLEYRIDGKIYPAGQVWHERQFRVAGLAVGLSPVAYAAWSIGEYQSIQQFALDWFGNGTLPSVHLRNTQKELGPNEAGVVKSRYKATVAAGDALVTGNDWELKPINAEAAGLQWVDAKQYGITDISRFFGCPADLIDAAVQGQSLTYANITERNLQFLIMNLGPAVYRREKALSKWLPAPRYVKLTTDALLRMDPKQRAETIRTRIESRQLAPSEARALENLPAFTDSQLAEFDRLFGKPRIQPDTANTGATP